jgi:hypothetical protein
MPIATRTSPSSAHPTVIHCRWNCTGKISPGEEPAAEEKGAVDRRGRHGRERSIRRKKPPDPLPHDEHRPGSGQGRQVAPAKRDGDGEKAQVEEAEIAKENDGGFISGRQKDGSQKPAENAKDRDKIGLEAHRDGEGGGRHGRHDRKRRERGKKCEMINRLAGERDGVEGHQTGGAEGPSQARSFTPRKRSQSMGRPAARSGFALAPSRGGGGVGCG